MSDSGGVAGETSGDMDSGYGGGSQADAGAQSDAQSAENESQGGYGGGGGEGFDPSNPDFSVDLSQPLNSTPDFSVDLSGPLHGSVVDPHEANIDYSYRSLEAIDQHISVGNYMEAIGHGIMGVAHHALGAFGSFMGTQFGGALGASLVGAIGVTNIGVAIGIVAVVSVVTTHFGKKAGTQLGLDMQQSMVSGQVTGQHVMDSLEGLIGGESDGGAAFAEKLKAALEMPPEEFLAMALETTETNINTLYRRRSNIIGTGRMGLTID